ncbi:hypothetical protein CDL12_29468 [Handroanthus impetiginosus]|uniref:Uncharacterized protein n=1 Tax=Handroanthus impetiginosus TaxID=429701 RepID=A0A2G9FYT6_9LAMI|nr:hypothetical protein CDL12_29468 [Handroanthus impetiginosus]
MKNKRICYATRRLFAIFLIICSSGFAFSLERPNSSVLDTEGNPLQTDTKYYIVPLNDSSGGGGLALSIRDPCNPCPPYVLQENDETAVGLSLKLFPVNQKRQAISLSTDVNVAFMAATICVQRTVWQIGGPDGITGQRYVRTDGVVGRPGPETVGNWFKIHESGKGYKIVYCPSVCGTCRVQCGDVGVFVENGRRWLGLDGEPLVIVFRKVQH